MEEDQMSTAFRVVLTGDQESNPTGSNATGLGTVIFNSRATIANYSVTVRGLDFGPVLGQPPQTESLNDDVGGIHVHNAARGDDGGVVFGQRHPEQDVDDFSASFNVDGSVTFSGVWETTDPASVSISNFANMLANAEVGEDVDLYWNIHTSAFPGGEIRGQWVCIATDGGDTVLGTEGDDLLPGLRGDDLVLGDLGSDELRGGAGIDRLRGGFGDDLLRGGAGDDRLRGAAGDDRYVGGSGADRFLFVDLLDSAVGDPDRIVDFDLEEGDRISLRRMDADPETEGDQAFVLVGAFTGAGGEVRFVYNPEHDRTNLFIDVDGDQRPDFELAINGDLGAGDGLIL
jgi:Ca2+-binding RTX toxin-like protein